MPQQNLLVIYLENVSQMAFWQYSSQMPTLFALMQRSTQFSQFFTTNIDPVLSLSDLLHGTAEELDHVEHWPAQTYTLAGRASNMFAILHANGYATRGIVYGAQSPGNHQTGFEGIWPAKSGAFVHHTDREAMHQDAKDVFASAATGKPFALCFWNRNTNPEDIDPLVDRKSLPYHEYFQSGYELLDQSVKRLLADLEAAGQLQRTLIVVVGGNGADLWRHGMYGGQVNGDPYANVCWTPYFMYNNDNDICIAQKLVSITDIKPTVLYMLLGREADPKVTPWTGINIIKDARPVAYTQILPSLADGRHSYAITNGDFRLMVSAPAGGKNDNGGVEFFLDQWDYGNTRNLLDFCQLDEHGNITAFGHPDAVHPHFRMTFNPKQTYNLVEAYGRLRMQLLTYIREKETLAQKTMHKEAKQVFDLRLLTWSRNRIRE